MSINNFQRTVWTKKIQRQLETITSLKDHCDFEFEGEIELASRLKVIGVNRPTINKYEPGKSIKREQGKDNSQFMDIDQFFYFNFEVDNVDKAQSQKGLIENLSKEATQGLSEQADSYIANLVKVNFNKLSHAETIVVSELEDGGISHIEEGFETLYNNNCKTSDKYHLEINATWYTKLRPYIIALDTNNSELIKKGYIGKYGNALISIENLLAKDDQGRTLCMLRTNKAIAYAGQIRNVKAYEPDDSFGDAVKGLLVFGAKIMRPKQIYVFPVKKSA